jgi:hypothetical protein
MLFDVDCFYRGWAITCDRSYEAFSGRDGCCDSTGNRTDTSPKA